MNTTNYYYLDDARKPCGPLSHEELLELHAKGTLSGEVMVAAVGGDKWRPLSALLTPNDDKKGGVGACPSCETELTLTGGELPELCPNCGKRLRPADFSFGACVQSAFAQYASFKGRSTRSEYWWFCLFNFIVSFAIGLVLGVMRVSEVTINSISILYSLATLLPGLAVGVRRLHDIGRSGFWLLIPVAIYITMIVCGAGLYFSVVATGSINSPASIALLGLLGVLFLALIGFCILFLVWLLTDSQRGPNKYGPSAKYPQ